MISSFLLKEQTLATILQLIKPDIVVKMTENYLGGPKLWYGNFIKMVQRKFNKS